MEKVAEGVWLLRGDVGESMNIYFIEDDGGVIQFDAGSKAMAKKARAAAEELGGLKRVVLGHAHADHRGTAPYLGVPVECHPDAVEEAESELSVKPYFDIGEIQFAPVRWIYPTLLRRWDGGPVKIDGTVAEGDEVAGFRVVLLPGHAPGQIALWRESDRVALVTDVVYLIESVGRRIGKHLPEGEASVPHPVWALDHEQAKESVRKLAALEPSVVGAGHAGPLRGENLRETLERAAEKY
jgi:glyoxylase-like metal-dependent hydrolase (beta-lactamase superfamily II)